MGCFDTVKVPCPRCGSIAYFQSKGGDCVLAEYDLDDCPADVMSDVNRHAPYSCDNCGALFSVKARWTTEVVSHHPDEEGA